MAALSADVAVVFDPSRNVGLRQAPSDAADTYFRGGLAHWASGELDIGTVGAGAQFAGVLMEHIVTAASGEMIWIATGGRFHWANATIALAVVESGFSLDIGDPEDDPSTMTVHAAGDSGVVGILDQVTVETTSGWIDISRRAIPTNL